MPVTKKQAKKVLAALVKQHPWCKEDWASEPQLREDDNGWTDGKTTRSGWFIFWEEGPYDWSFDFEYDEDGIYFESVTSWGLIEICKW